jgi:hypothetical protein
MSKAGRWLVGTGFGLAILAGAGFGYMELVKAGFIRYNRWDHRDRGTLKKGAQAPDLTLSLYEGGSVSLSSLWNQKPVLIVLGSCT